MNGQGGKPANTHCASTPRFPGDCRRRRSPAYGQDSGLPSPSRERRFGEVKKLNLKPFLNGHNIHEDVYIRAGDMIFVPDTFIAKFRKYVPYGASTGLGWSGNALVQ